MESTSINQLKLPRGLQHHGKNIRLDFAFDGNRYRITTRLRLLDKNVDKALKLMSSLRIDLERDQFYISNYKRILIDIDKLSTFDNSSNKNLKEISMHKLLEEQLEKYDVAHSNKVIAYSTLVNRISIIKQHLLPYFGGMAVDEISDLVLEEFIASLNLTRKRIHSILTPLKVVISRAKKNKLIKANPFESFDKAEIKLHSKASDYEIDPFNSLEKEAILNHADGQVKNIIQFAFWTGMRIGEIFALTWSDIDFENEVVHVNKTKSLGGFIKTTKTKSGIREVELTPLALDALKAQHPYTGKAKATIFCNPYTDKPWSKPGVFQRYWARILSNANVKYRNPHQMRHTFISFMLMKGNKPETLYHMVGHTNTEMIYRVYGKFIKGEIPGKKLIL